MNKTMKKTAGMLLGITMMTSVGSTAHADVSVLGATLTAGIAMAKVIGVTDHNDVLSHLEKIRGILATHENLLNHIQYVGTYAVVTRQGPTSTPGQPVMRSDATYVARPPMVIKVATPDQMAKLNAQIKEFKPLLVAHHQRAKSSMETIFSQLPDNRVFAAIKSDIRAEMQTVETQLNNNQFPQARKTIHEGANLNKEIASRET